MFDELCVTLTVLTDELTKALAKRIVEEESEFRLVAMSRMPKNVIIELAELIKP